MRLLLIRLARRLFFSTFALLTGCHNTDPTTGTTTVAGQVVESQSRL